MLKYNKCPRKYWPSLKSATSDLETCLIVATVFNQVNTVYYHDVQGHTVPKECAQYIMYIKHIWTDHIITSVKLELFKVFYIKRYTYYKVSACEFTVCHYCNCFAKIAVTSWLVLFFVFVGHFPI